MSYGTANDDERILTYAGGSSKDQTSGTSSPSSLQNLSTASSNNSSIPQSPSLQNANKSVNSSSSPPANGMRSSSPETVPERTNGTSVNGSAVVEQVSSYARQVWIDCRPWTEFYSTAAINLPAFQSLSDRVSTNVHLYRANYLVLAAFSLGLFVLSSIPSFLLAIIAFSLLGRSYIRLSARNGGKLPHRDMVLFCLAALAIIWVTGIAQYVLTSLAISSIFVISHAALHEPAIIETEIANV